MKTNAYVFPNLLIILQNYNTYKFVTIAFLIENDGILIGNSFSL